MYVARTQIQSIIRQKLHVVVCHITINMWQASPELQVKDIEIKQDMDFEDFLIKVKHEFERDVVFDYECGGALVRVERPRLYARVRACACCIYACKRVSVCVFVHVCGRRALCQMYFYATLSQPVS
jgi:hypothetical protein